MSAHTKQEADLWRKRAAVALTRAAERAESALKNSRPASAATIENHFANGGTGPLPGLDSMAQARLQENAILARRAADAAQLQLTGK
jgi:hypothetical protein